MQNKYAKANDKDNYVSFYKGQYLAWWVLVLIFLMFTVIFWGMFLISFGKKIKGEKLQDKEQRLKIMMKKKRPMKY